MRLRSSIAPLAVVVALSPGCRCTETPPEPVPSTASSAPRGPARCPPAPAWAPPPPNAEHLVVELLYPAPKSVERKGTGIRVFDDGLVETFDDRVVTMEAKKPKTTMMPEGWRWHAKLTHADVLANAVKVVSSEPAADLTDMQGPRFVEGKTEPTLLTVRQNGQLLRSCYLDAEGSGAQRRVEEAARKVVGDVPLNDPSDPVNAPPPVASALPKP